MSKSVYDCSIIELPRIGNEKGNITVVHGRVNLPFDIARVFYLYDIPGGEARGAHAHKMCHQFLVAASGSFEILLDDGHNKRTVTLNLTMDYIYLLEYGLQNKVSHRGPFVWF